MDSYLLIIHIVLAFLIISLVLLQHGKGAEVGASFGSGASNTIFGSKGSGSFLAKATIILALLFAISSISLTKLSGTYSKSDVIDVESLEKAPAVVPTKKYDPEIPVSSNTTVVKDPLLVDNFVGIGEQANIHQRAKQKQPAVKLNDKVASSSKSNNIDANVNVDDIPD